MIIILKTKKTRIRKIKIKMAIELGKEKYRKKIERYFLIKKNLI